MILTIKDHKTGEDRSEDYDLLVTNPEGVEDCQEGCTVSLSDNDRVRCQCDSESSVFDVGT